MHWLLEADVFAAGPHPLTAAARRAGHQVTRFTDRWWSRAELPALAEPVVFHGSLGNAARIAALGRWRPGAFCDEARLRCSSWYPATASWRLCAEHRASTVGALVADPIAVAGAFGDAVFVRPDSPLKPFAGRVVTLAGLSAADLDHGFYYDDLELPIVITPLRRVVAEWRFVIAAQTIVAASGYDPRRATSHAPPPDEARALASTIAAALAPPSRSTSWMSGSRATARGSSVSTRSRARICTAATPTRWSPRSRAR